jgi:hypothetical protein
MSRRSLTVLASAVAIAAAACSSGTSSPSAHSSAPSASVGTAALSSSGEPTEPGAETASPRPSCPNLDGGVCLGPLAPGTYHTMQFDPPLRYTVPAGWGNYEDTPGNFLLVPPGGDLAGVDPGTSDFIGVYSGVAAASFNCVNEGSAAAGVGTSPAQIAAYWAQLPATTTTAPRQVTVGGLNGLVLDITPNPAVAKAFCTDPSSSYGYEPLLEGIGPASLNHGMIKGLHLRVYLLTESDGSTLAIEVDDLHGGVNLATYSSIVDAMQF